ncbi:transposase [Streptomyces sp. NPDC052013]|uniref:transposase n=1 Tax=Streptomyces sp. NPDC052013 TaxID=3365679 RepID=UPI0037CEDA16
MTVRSLSEKRGAPHAGQGAQPRARFLIDIETRQPVDLLPDRTTSTVAWWLADHPGVEVMCRDRSAAYAEVGRIGAPETVHVAVADRWHIWSSLAEAVEKTVVQHRALLREPHNSAAVQVDAAMETLELVPISPAGLRTAGRLSDRVRGRHAAVHSLLNKGVGLRAISSGWLAIPSTASPTRGARTRSPHTSPTST